MNMTMNMPSRDEAEALLAWAEGQNPGPWADHCRGAARAAETIAQAAGLDIDRAYVSGLLHDIGRYEGVRGLHHTYAGYELLRGKGYEKLAEICLSHSFPFQQMEEYFGENDCTPEELAVINSYLMVIKYNDYDKLIQLCDTLGSAQGVCLMEKRMVDVVRRYGFSAYTLQKWEATFALKAYFDKLAACNIYDLFHEEIRRVTFA